MGIDEVTQNMNISQPEMALGVKIRTFGLVELENSFGRIMETSKSSGQSWRLLKYMLANYDWAVPAAELVDILWPNDAGNESFIRISINRLRTFLAPLQLTGKDGLILTSSGHYSLNSNYISQIDAVRFDQIIKLLDGLDLDDPSGLSLCSEALELYRGTYFEHTEETFPWLEKARKHYSESFYTLANNTLDRMKALDNQSVFPLLFARVSAFIPADDTIYDRINRFQNDQKLWNELCHFQSSEVDSTPAVISEDEVYIRLFGPLELKNQLGRVEVNFASQSNSWLLFKYLLVNRGFDVTEIELMETFWPDELEKTTDGAFRTRLSRLRTALKPLRLNGRNGLVLSDSGYFSLNPKYCIYTDEDIFTRLMSKISNTALDDPDGLSLCEAALNLFRGLFLAATEPDFWLDPYRAKYKQEFIRLANSSLDRIKALDDTRILPLLCRRVLEITPEEGVLNIEIIGFLVQKQMIHELIDYISKLSLYEGDGFEWLAPSAPSWEEPLDDLSENDVRIRLFGPVTLQNALECVMERPHPTLRWLVLKYLLANRGRPVSEDEFKSNVWPDKENNDPEMAQAQLRRRMREVLFPLGLTGRGLVHFFDGYYGLNPRYNLITDADILARNTDQLQATPVDDPTGLQLCSEALSLFRGPFMAYTLGAPWLTQQRNHYDQMYSSLVQTTLERMNALEMTQGLDLLWQSAIAYAPGDKNLHETLLNYMVVQKPSHEVVPYICALARLRSSETHWLSSL